MSTLKMKSFVAAVKAALLADATLSAKTTWSSGETDNVHLGAKGSIPADARFPCFSVSPVRETPERSSSSQGVDFTPKVDIYCYVYATTDEESLYGNASSELGLAQITDAIFEAFEHKSLGIGGDFDCHVLDIVYEEFFTGSEVSLKRVIGAVVSLEGYYHN